MNLLIQEKNKHNENCINVKVSRRTQNLIFHIVIFCTDLGNLFGEDFGDNKGVLMPGKGPHEP